MKAVVVGGAGFIGSNLCEALAEDKWEIFVLDDCSTGQNMDEVRTFPNTTFFKKDITKLELFEAKFIFHGADVVFNLVGRTSHAGSLKDPAGDAHANVTAPLSTLMWAREFCHEARIVYTGTRGQYGKIESCPVYEDHPMVPLDVNGINKKAAEEAHMLYSKFGMNITCLRLPNIFGPRHQTSTSDGVVNWFIFQALRGEKIRVYGGMRDILCVCEVVSALMRSALSPDCRGGIFNVGGRGMSLSKYANIVASLIPATVEMVNVENHLEIGDYIADASKLREAAGWDLSSSPVEFLIDDTIKWYKERL